VLSLNCLSSSFKAFAVVSITALLGFPLLVTYTPSKVAISTSLNRFRGLTSFFPRGAFASLDFNPEKKKKKKNKKLKVN